MGHPCIRHLVLLRLHWDKMTPHDLGLQYIFDEGNLQEERVVRDLLDAGIGYEQGQVGLNWKEYQITGHIDGAIRFDRDIYPLEIKSINQAWWGQIDTFEDIKKHKSWIVRKWAAQMTLYLLMKSQSKGLMLLKNKQSGRIKVLEVSLDYDLGEELVKKAEEINEHVKLNEVPEPMKWDEDVCGKCGFYPHLCMPDIIRDGTEIMDDPELEGDLARWWALKPLAKEWNDLDSRFKNDLKGRAGFCGDFEIGGKWIDNNGNPNPKPVAPYRYWKKSIRQLPGGKVEEEKVEPKPELATNQTDKNEMMKDLFERKE